MTDPQHVNLIQTVTETKRVIAIFSQQRTLPTQKFWTSVYKNPQWFLAAHF